MSWATLSLPAAFLTASNCWAAKTAVLNYWWGNHLFWKHLFVLNKSRQWINVQCIAYQLVGGSILCFASSLILESLSCHCPLIRCRNNWFECLSQPCKHRCPVSCHSGDCASSQLDCVTTVHVSCPCKRIKKAVACNVVSKQPAVSCDDICRRKKDQELKVHHNPAL